MKTSLEFLLDIYIAGTIGKIYQKLLDEVNSIEKEQDIKVIRKILFKAAGNLIGVTFEYPDNEQYPEICQRTYLCWATALKIEIREKLIIYSNQYNLTLPAKI